MPPDTFDDGDQLVDGIALPARELDEFARALGDRSALRRAGNGDAAAAPELEQALVAQQAQRAQDGVGVDAEDGSEVLGRRKTLAGLGLAVGDRAADLAGDLRVELARLVAVDLDSPNDARDSSVISTVVASPRSGAVDPLIEEARRRARRRRLRNTGAAVAVVAASAGYVGFDRAGGPAETTATGHPDLVANGALTILRATPSSTAISAVGTGGALRVLAVCDHNRHVGNWCNEPVSLAWAPDGQRVAVSAAFEGGAYQVSGVHLIDVRSGRDVQIPRAPVIHFADAGPGRDLFFPSARSVVPSEDAWLKRVVRRVGCFWPAELAWSPDGTTLAYRCGFPRFSGLNVLRVAGGRHRVIPDARHAFWPTWSPDGTRIAYSTTLRPRPGSRIVGVAPDGSHRTAMVRGGAAPAWSPDGRTIAYQSACGVRLVTPAGRDVTPGRATGTCGIGPTGRPVWSPDGRLIAVGAATGMYVMQVDGSGLHRLTGRTGNSFYGAEPGRPSWQPKPQPR